MRMFAKISAINARVAACTAEADGFRAANQDRERKGQVQGYDEEVFRAAAHNLRAFAHELDELAEQCKDKE